MNTGTQEETVNATTQGTEEKTFTQAEVNKIVSDRLQREAAKYADYETLKAQAAEAETNGEQVKSLQAELDGMKAAEALRTMREKVSKATGIPSSLLTEETEEACTAQAEAIKAFAKPTYPTVRDGGEVVNIGKPTTKQQFADWFNNEMKG